MIFTRITVDPRQMGGVPCIRGLRIPVATVVGMVADGMREDEILKACPDLESGDIREALRYAAETVRELVKNKRSEILRIATKHGVRQIRIFGSVVRGQAGPASDVDFLVEVGPKHSPFFPGGLVADLEDLLGRPVDVVEPEGIYPPLKELILKEAVPL